MIQPRALALLAVACLSGAVLAAALTPSRACPRCEAGGDASRREARSSVCRGECRSRAGRREARRRARPEDDGRHLAPRDRDLAWDRDDLRAAGRHLGRRYARVPRGGVAAGASPTCRRSTESSGATRGPASTRTPASSPARSPVQEARLPVGSRQAGGLVGGHPQGGRTAGEEDRPRPLAALPRDGGRRQEDGRGPEERPARIVFSTRPSILVYVDGTPSYQPVKDTKLQRVVNTRVLLLREEQGVHYLRVFDGWMKAPSLDGAWEVETKPDKGFEKAWPTPRRPARWTS